MKSIKVKGKDYVEVKERVKAFNKEYKDHYLLTEVHTFEEKYVLIVARIYDKDNRQVANGWAFERQSDGNVNKSSFVENCETSAVGRALGFFGIGIDASIASADEMQGSGNEEIITLLEKNIRTKLKKNPDASVSDILNNKKNTKEYDISLLVNTLGGL